ncbi:hypothetical protein OKW35_005105 [Paraburkholderia sp. MM5477-R1]
MPSKPKPGTEAQPALPSIPKELIDQFVKGPMTAETVRAASAAFKKALIERPLGATRLCGPPLKQYPFKSIICCLVFLSRVKTFPAALSGRLRSWPGQFGLHGGDKDLSSRTAFSSGRPSLI